LQILAIAAAMAAGCAAHPIPPPGAHHHGNLFSVALARWTNLSETTFVLQPDHTALAKIGFNVGVAGVNRPDGAIALIARSSREARAFAAPASAGQRPAIHRTEPEPELVVRAFAAPIGVPEDPETGSLNASLAQWLIDTGRMPAAYVAEQGAALGRVGRVHLERDASGQVWVGGHSVSCIVGEQWG
jgi:predicted PhzF superfamily epimerase YddE/YHI9